MTAGAGATACRRPRPAHRRSSAQLRDHATASVSGDRWPELSSLPDAFGPSPLAAMCVAWLERQMHVRPDVWRLPARGNSSAVMTRDSTTPTRDRWLLGALTRMRLDIYLRCADSLPCAGVRRVKGIPTGRSSSRHAREPPPRRGGVPPETWRARQRGPRLPCASARRGGRASTRSHGSGRRGARSASCSTGLKTTPSEDTGERRRDGRTNDEGRRSRENVVSAGLSCTSRSPAGARYLFGFDRLVLRQQ